MIPVDFFYIAILSMMCFGSVAVIALAGLAMMSLRLLGQADERIFNSAPVIPHTTPAHVPRFEHPATMIRSDAQ